MTVEKLIQILEKYPKDMPVAVSGYKSGWDDLEESGICIREVLLNIGEESYEGQHEEINLLTLARESISGDVKKILTISRLS